MAFDGGTHIREKCKHYEAQPTVSEVGSGAHVLVTSSKQRGPRVALSFVAMQNMGQALRSGRHGMRFHLAGPCRWCSVTDSSIVHSHSRAIAVHASNLVKLHRNVAYGVSGHAFALAEGFESGCDVRENAAILTSSSAVLAATDQSAAAFVLSTAAIQFKGNVAQGSTHFGIWIRTPSHSVRLPVGRPLLTDGLARERPIGHTLTLAATGRSDVARAAAGACFTGSLPCL